MPKNSYYAVCGGPKPGIYDTWAEASACCTNQRGANVKKFDTKEAARMWECRGANMSGSSAVQVPEGPGVSPGVSFLSCPFAEKDAAKQLGAKWDVARKAWYVPSGVALSPFARWLPGAVDAGLDMSSALGAPIADGDRKRAREGAPGNSAGAPAFSSAAPAYSAAPASSAASAYSAAPAYSRPAAPFAGLLLYTDGSCPGNRNVATTKNEAGGRTGWRERNPQHSTLRSAHAEERSGSCVRGRARR